MTQTQTDRFNSELSVISAKLVPGLNREQESRWYNHLTEYRLPFQARNDGNLENFAIKNLIIEYNLIKKLQKEEDIP